MDSTVSMCAAKRYGDMNIFKKAVHAFLIESAALRVLLQYGMPDVVLQFNGGIGDELLLSTVAYELKKRSPNIKIWQVSHSQELLQNNPAYHKTFSWDHWQLRYSRLLRFRTKRLAYAVEIVPKQSEIPVSSHILSILCNRAGVTGTIELRPYLYLSEEEKVLGRRHSRQIAVYCLGENSHASVMKNKIWGADKLQMVVDFFYKQHETEIQILQIGGKDDPPLNHAIDLRGETTLRESAAILSQSVCCITTVGLVMHMARAVNCPSVVIYGGREHSWQSGYTCNENAESFPECSPCWKWNDCDYEWKCMTAVSVEEVIAAVERIIRRRDMPLTIDTATI